MTDKEIDNIGKVGGDYFRLYYTRYKGKKLQEYLYQFNEEDYFNIAQARINSSEKYREFIKK